MNEFSAIADFLLNDRKNADLLNKPDRLLAEMGCLVVLSPSSSYLRQVLRDAISIGIIFEFIEAALIHAIGYVGILPTQTAYELLQESWAEAGLEIPDTAFAKIPEAQKERVDLGISFYSRFDPDRAAEQGKRFAVISPLYYPRALEISGLTLRSENIALKQRQIMTVAMLSSLGTELQLKFHIGVALDNGITKEQLTGILLFVQIYAGVPRANEAARIAREVLLDRKAD